MALSEDVVHVLQEAGLSVVARRTDPPVAPRFAQIPPRLHPDAAQALATFNNGNLWAHQAEGLSRVLAGQDICLATPTASGKSLVFMGAAIHRIKTEPGVKVLAIYPIKALIHDQRHKWSALLEGRGLKAAYIDGSVPTKDREAMLGRSDIVLMTPDVLHAWLLQRQDLAGVRRFLAALRLIILDEGHIYDGVLGSNFSYLMRRLQAVAAPFQLIVSTATIGEPEVFLKVLTGRDVSVIGPEESGTGSHGRGILCVPIPPKESFEAYVNVLRGLISARAGRFLAFADSRKLVEQVVARASSRGDAEEEPGEEPTTRDELRRRHVLPYRAGYEEEDRTAIQDALMRGALSGVVATSAMELGLDIGDLSVVVMLGTPPSAKAFWQRAGRTARKTFGVCVLLDSAGICSDSQESFDRYLARAAEPNWMYLDNKYLQFTNALCAATELQGAGVAIDDAAKVFASLPETFTRFVRNELNPTEVLPPELLQLKVRGGSSPHYEFPLRSAIDKQIQVLNRGPIPRLGTLSMAQVLREAYPGAIYYYLARPYRVVRHKLRMSEIETKRERNWTTKPVAQNMVFPKFNGGTLNLLTGPAGFVAEAELQVSERVLGFVEKRGSVEVPVHYGAGNDYAQGPLTRYFETTGVCWRLTDGDLSGERLATALMDAFCSLYSVQRRDVGHGVFYAKAGPLGPGEVKGACIYDATYGSLRLTQRVFDNFQDIVEEAKRREVAEYGGNTPFLKLLTKLGAATVELKVATVAPTGIAAPIQEGPWVKTVRPGSPAVLRDPSGTTEEVVVKDYRYTPSGLMYELEHTKPNVAWRVDAVNVLPIPGLTTFVEVNFETDETRDAAE